MTDPTPAQPGYDALARRYADTFPTAFVDPLEEAAVDAFVGEVGASGLGAGVIDVGCGIGHTAAHLADRGCTVLGVEPSAGMLAIARESHPGLRFASGDARLVGHALHDVAGLMARFSLIHVPPADVRAVLADWARRSRPGTVVLLAGQAADEPGVHEFDHLVARAWRWHPDTVADALRDAGFAERWRTVSRPDAVHRFPEFHVCAVRT